MAREHVGNLDAKFGKGEEYCVELLRYDPKFNCERYQARLKVRCICRLDLVVGVIKLLVISYCDKSCAKRTCAVASVERRLREPDSAIIPE